jgi:peptide/nickel transport system substrate-binding protein
MEQLRDAFVRATDPEKQKKLAEQIQIRAMEVVTHASAGQYYVPSAWRKDRVDGVLNGPVPYFWNVTKK